VLGDELRRKLEVVIGGAVSRIEGHRANITRVARCLVMPIPVLILTDRDAHLRDLDFETLSPADAVTKSILNRAALPLLARLLNKPGRNNHVSRRL
jgi:hypothetical protein